MELTHLDRVYRPELGLTKGHLVEYYRALAPTLLPHLHFLLGPGAALPTLR